MGVPERKCSQPAVPSFLRTFANLAPLLYVLILPYCPTP